jgi:hypothetical protein
MVNRPRGLRWGRTLEPMRAPSIEASLQDNRAKTPWRVLCPQHGPVFLSHEEYEAQMNASAHPWCCPLFEVANPSDPKSGPAICGAAAEWDDAWYDQWCADAQGTEVRTKTIEGCLACNTDPKEREMMRSMLAERGIRVEPVPTSGHGNAVVCPRCNQAWILLPRDEDQPLPS